MRISFLAQLINFGSPVLNEDIWYAAFLTCLEGLGKYQVDHLVLNLLFKTLCIIETSTLQIRISFLIAISSAEKLDLTAILLTAMFLQERVTLQVQLKLLTHIAAKTHLN